MRTIAQLRCPADPADGARAGKPQIMLAARQDIDTLDPHITNGPPRARS
jgi:hypothetical protein